MPFICYRVVRSLPPTRNDFLSAKALGKRPRPEQIRTPILYEGVSVRDNLKSLMAMIADGTLHGMIVELAVPGGAPVGIHKTLGPEHWTLIGNADYLLGCVVRVVYSGSHP